MLPPWAGLKNTVPRWWSASSMSSAAVSEGTASTMRMDVVVVAQVKIGIRVRVMPGARSRSTVTMKLMAPSSELVPTISRPRIHRSSPVPPCRESGT